MRFLRVRIFSPFCDLPQTAFFSLRKLSLSHIITVMKREVCIMTWLIQTDSLVVGPH